MKDYFYLDNVYDEHVDYDEDLNEFSNAYNNMLAAEDHDPVEDLVDAMG